VNDFSAFGSLERGSWSDPTRATGYVELFASASDQAIESLLDAAGARPNLNALDLCCGQGNVSEGLIRRGCKVVGIDFSPAMLAFARNRHQMQFLSREMRSLCLSATRNLMSLFQIWVFVTYPINRARYPKCDESFDQLAALR
jgi:2-polyprenyl-3-methyl-5-hydroxy-6-metoxy-1,4-benzoquinol methylase